MGNLWVKGCQQKQLTALRLDRSAERVVFEQSMQMLLFQTSCNPLQLIQVVSFTVNFFNHHTEAPDNRSTLQEWPPLLMQKLLYTTARSASGE